MKIRREPFAQWHAEAAPLFAAHWQEVGSFKDRIALDIDIERIVALEKAGLWHAWTARDESSGALAGYCCVLVAPHLHYRGLPFAYVDVIYLAPAYRGARTSLRMIETMESGLPPVAKIVFHVKVEHDFGALLGRLGYVCTEKNFEKVMI
jgi:hypothetical protein